MFTVNVSVKNTNPNVYKQLKKRLEQISRKQVVAGFPKGKLNSPYYDNGASIIDVAIWNEFGTDFIPRRDFMGPAAEKWNEYFKLKVEERKDEIITGKIDIDQFLDEMGIQGAEFISGSIVALRKPPNAPSTIRRKGSDNPLVDTGALHRSTLHEIRMKQ